MKCTHHRLSLVPSQSSMWHRHGVDAMISQYCVVVALRFAGVRTRVTVRSSAHRELLRIQNRA